MYTKHVDELKGTSREAEGDGWKSRKLILASEQVGFSLSDTILAAGTVVELWYANHVEAVYCVGGRATLTTLEDGKKFEVSDGFLYMLNGHEKHKLEVKEPCRMVCIFNPPLTGREKHDDNGTYPLLTEER